MKSSRVLLTFPSLLTACLVSAAFLTAASAQQPALPGPIPGHHSAILAETPPMGWNSWDGYGTTINEKEFRANAEWFAKHLKPFGLKYVTIDMEWFVTNPVPTGNSKASKFFMDDYGRYMPPSTRFPSAADGKGFKPIAAYAHSLGLKLGIHILQGIPKEAVEKNLP